MGQEGGTAGTGVIKMRVLVYTRVSSAGQVDKNGPARQADKIASYCEANGLEPVRAFFEAGVSGTVEGLDRPAFAEMLAVAESLGDIDGIVVERLDRFARDLMVQELLIRECRERKLKLFAADQGALIDLTADDSDPTRKLIRQILGALSEWEKSCIVLKLRLAREKVKAETGRCEGCKPYGGRPAEREIMAFARGFAKTGATTPEVAEALNGAGFRTRKHGLWDARSARRLIARATED